MLACIGVCVEVKEHHPGSVSTTEVTENDLTLSALDCKYIKLISCLDIP